LAAEAVRRKAYLTCAFAAFGGIFFASDSGYINGVMAMKYFVHIFSSFPYPTADTTRAELAAFNIPAVHKSLIVSILSAGTIFDALIAGDLADFISRRMTNIAGCGIFTLDVILQTAATTPMPSSKRNQGIFFEHGITTHCVADMEHRALNVEELPSSAQKHEEVELAKAKLKAVAGLATSSRFRFRYPDSDVDRSRQQ
jgi:Sugar (and other) transporter